MVFSKYIELCSHHNSILEHFCHPNPNLMKLVIYFLRLSTYLLHTSYCNHLISGLFHLASFTWSKVFEVHPCAVSVICFSWFLDNVRLYENATFHLLPVGKLYTFSCVLSKPAMDCVLQIGGEYMVSFLLDEC